MTLRRRVSFSRLVGFMLLSGTLVGCGQNGTAPPQVPAPAEPAANGGPAASTPAAGPGATAAAATTAATETPPRATTPATLTEALAAVDLRKLPSGEGMSDVDLNVADATYNINMPTGAAMDDARAKLTTLGFREDSRTGESYQSPEFAQGSFTKGDFRLFVSVTQKFDDKSASNVRLQNMGNVDSRTLPPLPDAKILYGGPSSTIYVTPASVADTVAAARKLLAAAGWQEYGANSASVVDNPDQKSLNFKQNAINLSAFIGVAPAQGNQTTMQYGTTLLTHELPAHPAAVEIEYEDYRPDLSYELDQPIAAVADFYRTALAQRGWQLQLDASVDNDQRSSLTFEHPAMAEVMFVEIRQSDDKLTKVHVEQVSAALLAEAKAAQAEREAAEMAEDPAEPMVERLTVTAQDLPIPTGAKQVAFDTDAGDITYKSDQPIADLMAFTTEKLTAAGWEKGEFGVETENAAVSDFKKGDAELDLRMINIGLGDGTEVTISGSEIDWQLEGLADMSAPDKPEPLTAEMHNGLPIPSDNQGFSAGGSQFRVEGTAASSSEVATLVEFYRRELGLLKWQEVADRAKIEPESANLYFTTPDGSGILKLRRDGEVTNIELYARNVAAARKAGLLPKPDKARVIFGNSSGKAVTLTINKQTIKLKPGEGEQKPDGPSLDLPPGEYTVEAIIDGKPADPATVTLGPDETWAGVVLEGVLMLQMY